MLALLKLIPLKDYLWAALVVGLLSAFGVYTVHERHEGAAKIEAADAKAVAAQAAHDKLLENVAVETINVTAQKYAAAISSPIVDSPHVFVRNVARDPGTVPGTGNSACSAPSAADVSEASPSNTSPGGEYDIGPSLDRLGRDADAQIQALQAIIKADRIEYGIAP